MVLSAGVNLYMSLYVHMHIPGWSFIVRMPARGEQTIFLLLFHIFNLTSVTALWISSGNMSHGFPPL